ncbi:hypothetical protein ABFS83_08G143000 [Erythranthe nasuta]
MESGKKDLFSHGHRGIEASPSSIQLADKFSPSPPGIYIFFLYAHCFTITLRYLDLENEKVRQISHSVVAPLAVSENERRCTSQMKLLFSPYNSSTFACY